MPDPSTADSLIDRLQLAAHPEGGWYRRTWASDHHDATGRTSGTCIYYLLKAGECSHWHRIDAVEIWHYYAGAPLTLRLTEGEPDLERSVVLGPDVLAGQQPQCIVPGNTWQSAVSTGEYTLVGCTVSPGFVFDTFELAPPGFPSV